MVAPHDDGALHRDDAPSVAAVAAAAAAPHDDGAQHRDDAPPVAAVAAAAPHDDGAQHRDDAPPVAAAAAAAPLGNDGQTVAAAARPQQPVTAQVFRVCFVERYLFKYH